MPNMKQQASAVRNALANHRKPNSKPNQKGKPKPRSAPPTGTPKPHPNKPLDQRIDQDTGLRAWEVSVIAKKLGVNRQKVKFLWQKAMEHALAVCKPPAEHMDVKHEKKGRLPDNSLFTVHWDGKAWHGVLTVPSFDSIKAEGNGIFRLLDHLDTLHRIAAKKAAESAKIPVSAPSEEEKTTE